MLVVDGVHIVVVTVSGRSQQLRQLVIVLGWMGSMVTTGMVTAGEV